MMITDRLRLMRRQNILQIYYPIDYIIAASEEKFLIEEREKKYFSGGQTVHVGDKFYIFL